MADQDGKVVMTLYDNYIYYGYYLSGKPEELYAAPFIKGDHLPPDSLERPESGRPKADCPDRSILGNVYAARVDKLADGIKGAFLDIGQGGKCYYPLSRKAMPLILSGRSDGSLKGGDIVLIQIVKETGGSKLPVADGNITFSGKYMVLTLTDHRYGVSRKIRDEEERGRLKSLLEGMKSARFGLIMRTRAAGVSEEILTREFRMLKGRLFDLLGKAACARAGSLLYEEPPHYLSYPGELGAGQVSEILTDDRVLYEELRAYYNGDQDTFSRISFYEDDYSLAKLYRMGHFYEKALSKKVYLPSGAWLMIEPTEAMTVIDVNSGSVIKNPRKREEVYYSINLEAAKEVAGQLKLRNLSGIVVIDFINMDSEEKEALLLKKLAGYCAGDRMAVRVVDMTALGLVELTREKVRKPLRDQVPKEIFKGGIFS